MEKEERSKGIAQSFYIILAMAFDVVDVKTCFFSVLLRFTFDGKKKRRGAHG